MNGAESHARSNPLASAKSPRSFADRHPVSTVTGGDDVAGQAGGAVEDVDSQDM
jgi:hypothetical protein